MSSQIADRTMTDHTLRTLLEHSPDMVFVKDLTLTYQNASLSCARALGCATISELVGKTNRDVMQSDKLIRFFEQTDRRVLETGEPIVDLVEELAPLDGAPLYGATSKYPVLSSSGEIIGLLGITRDITREYLAQQNFSRELGILSEMPADGQLLAVVDVTNWRLLSSVIRNECGESEALRMSPDELLERLRTSVMSSNDAERFFANLSQKTLTELHDVGNRRFELRFRQQSNGRTAPMLCECSLIYDPIAQKLVAVFLLRADENAQEPDELARLADLDVMTGLYHHEATLRHIDQYLRGEGAIGIHALYMIDLDDFKQVNDRFGHPMGDKVIRDVSAAVRRCFADTDIVGRVGGDEFLALGKNMASAEDIHARARNLLDAMQYVCSTPEAVIALTGSVGVTIYQRDGKSLDQLYSEADSALYHAKHDGKNSIAFSTVGSMLVSKELPTGGVHLNTLLENMDGGMLIVQTQPDLHVSYASPSCFLHLPVIDAGDPNLMQALLNTVVAEDRPALNAAVKQALYETGRLDHSFRVYMKEQIKWFNARGSLLPDRETQEMLVVLTNISTLKARQQALEFAELRFTTALQQSNLMLAEVDLRQRTVRFIGPLAARMDCEGVTYAIGADEMFHYGALHPDCRAVYEQLCHNVLSGNDRESYDLMLLAPDGEAIPVRVHFSLLRDEQGPYYAVGTVEPYMSGQELQLYRSMTDGGVFRTLLDDQFTLLYGNDRFFAMHGFSREEMRTRMGNQCRAYLHPDDYAPIRRRIDEALRAKQETVQWVHRAVMADGTLRYFQTTGRFERQPDGMWAMSGLSIDVIKQKQAEQALQAQKDELTKRYGQVMSLREQADGEALYTVYINLTRDQYDRSPLACLGRDVTAWDTSLSELIASLSAQCLTSAKGEQLAQALMPSQLLRCFEQGENVVEQEYEAMQSSGQLQWLKTTVSMARNPDSGDVEGLLCTRSIEREKIADLLTRHTIDMDYEFIGILNTATDVLTPFFRCGKGGEHSPAFPLKMNDNTEHFVSFVPENDRDRVRRKLATATVLEELADAPNYAVSMSVVTANGSMQKKWQFSWLDRYRGLIALACTDSTVLHEAEIDALSGLYHKQAFVRHAHRRVLRHPDEDYVLVRFDIDRFKALNDVLGVDAGDALLCDLGAMLRQTYREEWVLGRVNADHFVMFGKRSMFDAVRITEQLDRWLSEYPLQFHLTVSIGVYLVEDPMMDVSLMCDRAMLALRSVKQSYITKLAFYEDHLRRQLLEEQLLMGDVEEALASEQFVLYFQPQVNYADGTLIGAEALVRWQHPRLGLLPPGRFIPLFEKNGFISRLDEYVWEHACRTMRTWRERKEKLLPISVSVNISRLDIYDPRLCDKIANLARKYDVPPAFFKLEITESAYMENPEQLIEVVKRLQTLGFVVEMDDFGSGYSSLNTLKDVPVDILKLDVRFLSSGMDDSRGGNILSSVIRMARWLKLPIIAEGVETRAQADYLKSLSCLTMQGYFFGKPMPVDEFTALLARSSVSDHNPYQQVSLEGVAAFWDASTQKALLFNSFVGGAAIMEYRNGKAEILRANDAFFREINTSRESYYERMTHFLDFYDEINRAKMEAMLRKAETSGEECECETLGGPLGTTQSRQWTHNRARLLARNNGSSLIYVSVENVTTRVMLQQLQHKQSLELEKKTLMMESLCHTLPCGVLQCTVKGQVFTTVNFNASLMRMLGYTGSDALREVLARDDLRVHCYMDDLPLVNAARLKLLETKEPVVLEYRLLRRNGNIAWVHAQLSITQPTGDLPLVQAVYFDITHQKRNAVRKFSDALVELFDEIYELDYARGTCTLHSSRYNSRYNVGVSRPLDKAIQQWLSTHVHPDDHEKLRSFFAKDRQAMDGSSVIEYRVLTEDNAYHVLRATALHVHRDISLLCNLSITKPDGEQ